MSDICSAGLCSSRQIDPENLKVKTKNFVLGFNGTREMKRHV